jgi:hypothetical protein
MLQTRKTKYRFVVYLVWPLGVSGKAVAVMAALYLIAR